MSFAAATKSSRSAMRYPSGLRSRFAPAIKACDCINAIRSLTLRESMCSEHSMSFAQGMTTTSLLMCRQISLLMRTDSCSETCSGNAAALNIAFWILRSCSYDSSVQMTS